MRLDRKKKYAYDALNRLSIVTMDSIAQKIKCISRDPSGYFLQLGKPPEEEGLP